MSYVSWAEELLLQLTETTWLVLSVLVRFAGSFAIETFRKRPQSVRHPSAARARRSSGSLSLPCLPGGHDAGGAKCAVNWGAVNIDMSDGL